MHRSTPMDPARRAILATLLGAGCGLARAATHGEKIVLGQTLAISSGSDGSAVRVIDGAKACVGAVNAAGGILGRHIELVTVDGGQDPAAHARNAHALVTEHGAIALLNCWGDPACHAVAQVARELRVPLVGAVALSHDLLRGRSHNRYVFPVRPGLDRQAEALVRQLVAMGVSRVAVLAEQSAHNERLDALKVLLDRSSIAATTITVDRARQETFEAAILAIGAKPYQGVIVDLPSDAIEVMAERRLTLRPEWPRVLASLASQSLITLSGAFPDRVIGFVNVVPNVESGTALTQEFQRQAERYSSGQAINFEGLEAYVNTRVCVEALSRINGRPDAARLTDALEGLDRVSLGGFIVSFAGGRESGSDWVDVGIRSRTGSYLK
jgi:branched-chain amino acid transport system substrate-binding protein